MHTDDLESRHRPIVPPTDIGGGNTSAQPPRGRGRGHSQLTSHEAAIAADSKSGCTRDPDVEIDGTVRHDDHCALLRALDRALAELLNLSADYCYRHPAELGALLWPGRKGARGRLRFHWPATLAALPTCPTAP